MTDRPKILIIDDEEVVLDSCTQILKGSSYRIVTAADGSAGLQRVRDFQPDLVFVDLKMPGISGFDVLDQIQSVDATIVTVVITGFATVSSAVDAMKKGAYDFLPKPFTPDEFRLITRRGIERRRLVQEAIALRREKEMLREQFASIVSHELKAPLGAVQQNLFALEYELAETLTDDQKEKLDRAKARIDELLKLIGSWLRVISVDINKVREGFQRLSIAAPLDNAIESMEPYAARKNITVEKKMGPGLDPVLGDPVSLTEVFVNILSNAVKYSPEGSLIQVSAERSTGEVLVTLQDHGIGIDKEDLPHVFEGFYRGKAGQAASAGHGIGLAVSKQIVEAHNGTIEVESEPGSGTTFRVRLPAARA